MPMAEIFSALAAWSRFEIFAAIIVVVSIWLAARRSLWTYPPGIGAVILYAWIFWQYRLYSDAILQGYFLVILLYGWVSWSRARDDGGRVIPELLAWRTRGLAVVVAIAASLAWGWVMFTYTDAAAPFWDALIAGLSVMGQLLQARRKIEAWVFWLAVNTIAVPLFWSRELYPTSILYGLLWAMALMGLISWSRRLRAAARSASLGGAT